MPELPEVEIIKQQLNKEIVGFRIIDVWFDTAKILKPSPQVFIREAKGQVIEKIARRAKFLVFKLEEGFLVAHLRLSGRLLVRKPGEKSDEYVHVVIKLQREKDPVSNDWKKVLELRFAEARKFGYLQYVGTKEELDKILSVYGPDAWSDLTEEEFRGILQKNKRRIKDLLMDQGVIAGIGNIYANDALWIAKIHPETLAYRIPDNLKDKLFLAVLAVLQEALKEGGSSDQWYRQIHGEKGHYQEHFKVYGRKGEACYQCKEKIEYIKVGQRGTFYCPRCQKREFSNS